MSSLEVSGLTVRSTNGDLLLRDIGFTLQPGEIVGLVGESGSGKSMTALALNGLLLDSMEPVNGHASVGADNYIVDGHFEHRPRMAMIFQNARSALNPTMKVGKQVERVLRTHGTVPKHQLRARAVELFEQVGIPGAERVHGSYPHQLSGGMNQRVTIAMALAIEPSVLVADEPTTGLDVTVQAQVLELLKTTVNGSDRSVLLITHDLGVVAQLCDRVVVMYGGQVMEVSPTKELFEHPGNPYTRELLTSIDSAVDVESDNIPVDFKLTGCRLQRRCPHATALCDTPPPMIAVGDSLVACHYAKELVMVA